VLENEKEGDGSSPWKEWRAGCFHFFFFMAKISLLNLSTSSLFLYIKKSFLSSSLYG
jgi:hypothetical protein